jgi:hypothetical protein
MNRGPGAAGLLWLWAVVDERGPGDTIEPSSRPPPDRDHDLRRPPGPPES